MNRNVMTQAKKYFNILAKEMKNLVNSLSVKGFKLVYLI